MMNNKQINFKNGFYRVIASDYYGEWENITASSEPRRKLSDEDYASDRLVPGGFILVAKSPSDRNPVKARLAMTNATGSAQIDMNGFADHFTTRKLYAELIGMKLAGRTPAIPLKGLWIKPLGKPAAPRTKKTKKTR